MPVNLGSGSISKIYVGDREVIRAYVGSTLVYSAKWTPSLISTLAWYDADDTSTITLNGSNVSQWNDKSGNTHHVTQASASAQPEFVQDAQNGRSGIRFTTSTLEDPTLLLTGRPWECHVVFKTLAWRLAPRAVTLLDSGIDGGPGGWMVVLQSVNGGITQAYQTSHCLPATSITLGQAYIQRSTVESNATYWINGVYRGQNGTANDLNTTDGLRLGWNSGATRYDGDLYEIVFTPLLEPPDRQKMEGYLAHKWGLSANLPTAHPYKSSVPIV